MITAKQALAFTNTNLLGAQALEEIEKLIIEASKEGLLCVTYEGDVTKIGVDEELNKLGYLIQLTPDYEGNTVTRIRWDVG